MNISERTALLKKALKKAEEAEKLISKARKYNLHTGLYRKPKTVEEYAKYDNALKEEQEDLKAYSIITNIDEISGFNDASNALNTAIVRLKGAIIKMEEKEAAGAASQ